MFFRMVYKSGQIFLPFCHNSRVWRTDRQTDGRTDRNLITIPRLHYMQRGKNYLWCTHSTGCKEFLYDKNMLSEAVSLPIIIWVTDKIQ